MKKLVLYSDLQNKNTTQDNINISMNTLRYLVVFERNLAVHYRDFCRMLKVDMVQMINFGEEKRLRDNF